MWEQLARNARVSLSTAGNDLCRGGISMLTAGLNELAMLRFLVVHGGRSGDGFALFLMGAVAFGVLIWALSHSSSSNNQSAKG
jgi:hypothetical protein